MRILNLCKMSTGYAQNVWNNKDDMDSFLLNYENKLKENLNSGLITSEDYDKSISILLRRNIYKEDFISSLKI